MDARALKRKKSKVQNEGGRIWLTVERPLAHVRPLVSAHVTSPFPKFVRFVFDDGSTRAALRVTVGKGTFHKKVSAQTPAPTWGPPPYTVGSLAAQFE